MGVVDAKPLAEENSEFCPRNFARGVKVHLVESARRYVATAVFFVIVVVKGWCQDGILSDRRPYVSFMRWTSDTVNFVPRKISSSSSLRARGEHSAKSAAVHAAATAAAA